MTLFNHEVQVGLGIQGLVSNVQMHRPRRAGGSLAEGLSHGVGDALHLVYLVAGLGDGVEGGGVVVLLVDVAVAVLGGDGVGHGDDG